MEFCKRTQFIGHYHALEKVMHAKRSSIIISRLQDNRQHKARSIPPRERTLPSIERTRQSIVA